MSIEFDQSECARAKAMAEQIGKQWWEARSTEPNGDTTSDTRGDCYDVKFYISDNYSAPSADSPPPYSTLFYRYQTALNQLRDAWLGLSV